MTETNEKPLPQIDPLALKRYSICQVCKYFDAEKKVCKICGCEMKRLVNNEDAQCPIGKW